MVQQRILVLCCIFLTSFSEIFAQTGYITGDFHQHSTYTDGSYSFGKMMEMNNQFGLDWWANSEHGGAFNRWGTVSGIDLGATVRWPDTGISLLGDVNTVDSTTMWRWQMLRDWSFRDVLLWRRIFPNKLILQGFEWNVPGHEHASVVIVDRQCLDSFPDATTLSRFEYMFDENDRDLSEPFDWKKSINTGHEKAVEAVRWLKANHPWDSWFIINHPERFDGAWLINQVRDLNTLAPDVFFGFTSVPGHQMATNRGGYSSSFPSYGISTYGGVGLMAAKVGGYWDALLSEGRRFWLFANSDCHNNEPDGTDFFPGEYLKNYTWVLRKNDPQVLVDGLRSGNNYVVMGDLIDSLHFCIGDSSIGKVFRSDMDSVTVSVVLHDPVGKNFNRYSDYIMPSLDHVDLIAGVVSSRINAADTADYQSDFISTTKVIARFAGVGGVTDPTGVRTQAWIDLGNGWKKFEHRFGLKPGIKVYFRLRGTNKGLDEPGETDPAGNPLIDVEGMNSDSLAFSDLWFYSNPVYAESTLPVILQSISSKGWDAFTDPESNLLNVAFKKPYTGLLELFDLSGKCMLSQTLSREFSFQIPLKRYAVGIYYLKINGVGQKVWVK